MADANEEQTEHKILLVKNESDVDVILNIYSGWSPICKITTYSKIIKPNDRYLYDEKALFKFKIVAKTNDEGRKNILGPLEWAENKVILITKSLECQSERFAKIENCRQIALGDIRGEEELPDNLYNILELDMEEVRKMKNEDAKRAIKTAFRRQVLIWHPDKNPRGDIEIVKLIIEAKNILMDDAKRARYHNEVDYDKGWFSRKRFKAIFRPDCYTEEQKKAAKLRIRLTIASLLLGATGIICSIATFFLPFLKIPGEALTGACIQSLKYIVSKECVVDGCNVRSWAKYGVAGGLVGAGTGAASGFISAAINIDDFVAAFAKGFIESPGSDVAMVLAKITAEEFVEGL